MKTKNLHVDSEQHADSPADRKAHTIWALLTNDRALSICGLSAAVVIVKGFNAIIVAFDTARRSSSI
jgi:hypothetical protein